MKETILRSKKRLVLVGFLLLVFSSAIGSNTLFIPLTEWVAKWSRSFPQLYGILITICMLIPHLSFFLGMVLVLIGLFLIFREKYPLKPLTYICILGILVGGGLLSGGFWHDVLHPIIFNASGDYRIPGVSHLFLQLSFFLVFGWVYGIPIFVASVIGFIYCAGKSQTFLSKLRLLLPCHDGVLAVILGCVSAVCGPFTYYLITYFAGWGIFSWGISFLLFFFGSGVSLICFFFLRQLILSTRKTQRASTTIVAILVFVIHYVIVFQFMPAGALIWTDGFVDGIKSRVDLDELQAWAVNTLSDYQEGTLPTAGEPEYWSPAKDKLDPERLPEYVQNIWATPPSVGIVTPDHSTVGDHCIAISWYLFGILVGEPDFQSQWTPWHQSQGRNQINRMNHRMKRFNGYSSI